MPVGIDADEHPSTQAAVRDLVVLDRVTLDDGNSYALFDGAAESALLFVANETDDETGVVTTDGDGNNADIVDGTNYGNASGNSANNVFHDGSDYVVENSTGSDGRDYTIVGVRVV
jgi:hypothetical protein